MFKKLLVAGALVTGMGVAGTTTEVQAGDRHRYRGDRGGWNHGHHHHHHHHRGGWNGGRVRIQPYPYYGGGFGRQGGFYGRQGGFYGRPWGGGFRGGNDVFIGGRNFSFGYFGR